MAVSDAELWAVCGPCRRSFFVSSETATVPETVACPVCAESPERFEQRVDDQVVGLLTTPSQALT